MIRIATAALLIILPSAAWSCDNVSALLRQAYPEAVSSSGALILEGAYRQSISIDNVACKAWPYKPELMLLAVPLIEAEPAEEIRGDVEIIVADSASGNVIARRREVGMAFGDAIRFDGVTLDTARYDIKTGERAFGIVTAQGGSSRVNPYSESALWLYTLNDNNLDRVLNGLVVDRLTGENDGDCTGTSEQIKRSVTIQPGANGEYNDLLIERAGHSLLTKQAGSKCLSAKVPFTLDPVLLKYQNGQYLPVGAERDEGLFSSIEIEDAN